jgi:uncharacterized protein
LAKAIWAILLWPPIRHIFGQSDLGDTALATNDMSKLFGREIEKGILDEVYASGRAEFVAIYGRRRVGKTHLIRECYQHRGGVYFEFTGQKDAPLVLQLRNFQESLEKVFYAGKQISTLDSWATAFKILAAALRATPARMPGGRNVVFLDELPWMALRKSGLIQALDHVWNTQFSKMPGVILVVCGSAASWMIDKLIHAKGGLHNRLTRQIRLMPFTLPETVAFLAARKLRFGLRAATESYMAIGGVPHYLQLLDKQLSASQNIANLCFTENGPLRTEFTRLFRALFGESETYEKIVRTLAMRRRGMQRDELLSLLKTGSGGGINRRLTELEEAGFIARMTPYNKRRMHATYRVIDPYILFYLRWIENAPGGIFTGSGAKYWLEKSRTPAYAAWAGYAYENLCLTHSALIQKSLGLDHVSCEIGSWSYQTPAGRREARGAQIDLLFDRADGIISLCEIKFSTQPFSVDKAYARELKNKLDVFQSITKTRKDLQLVLITHEGFKPNTWSEDLVNMTLDAAKIFTPAVS